jgi:chemotaxis protein CheC
MTDSWTELVSTGVTNAIAGMSEMIGQEIIISKFKATSINLRDASQLLGGPEAETAAIYLSISGPASGHMILVYQPQTAFDLIDLLMGEQAGATNSLGEMEESVLAEMGNIVGSFFLNAISDATRLDLRVSPPAVMMDMAGAVLDPILAERMMETDAALVVETAFGTKDCQIDGMFLAMPSIELQAILLERWRSE